MAVLLQGPPKLVEQRGPRLVRELQDIEGVEVLSPWAIGGERVLKEPRGQALLALQVRRPFDRISDETVPAVQKAIDRAVRPPLKAQITGLAPLVRALNQSSIDSLHRGELLALPILFVMLLLIFGSPVAALVPALSGLLVTRIGIAALGLDRPRDRHRRARAEPRDDGRPRARRRLRAARRLALPRGAGARA